MVDYVGNNAIIGTGAAGVVGLTIGGIVGYSAGSRKRKKTKAKNRKQSYNKSRKKGKKLKFGSPAYRKKYLSKRKKQKKPYTAGKRKDTSRRRIRYTKNNQPYVILSNGRARFISKRSASTSKKRQGGKY